MAGRQEEQEGVAGKQVGQEEQEGVAVRQVEQEEHWLAVQQTPARE